VGGKSGTIKERVLHQGNSMLVLREATMNLPELNSEQEAEAQRIEEILRERMLTEARHMAVLLASKPNRELLGQTEFQLRDACHRLGASALDAALEERKKRGIKGRV
jgi:hypothetical protein